MTPSVTSALRSWIFEVSIYKVSNYIRYYNMASGIPLPICTKVPCRLCLANINMPLAKQNNQSYSTFLPCKPKAESLGEQLAPSCHLFRVAEGTLFLAYTHVFPNATRRLLQLDPGYSWDESKRHTARQVFIRCLAQLHPNRQPSPSQCLLGCTDDPATTVREPKRASAFFALAIF